MTATLEFASISAVIAVARYSGVASVDPVRPLVAGNTNGIDGACANGTDSASFSFTVTPTQSHSVFLAHWRFVTRHTRQSRVTPS